jgi:capsid protein
MATKSSGIKKSNHGGSRPGAGRPRKVDAKAAAFEAAEYSPNRSLIWLNTHDPRRETSPRTRTELLKKARWLYNNVPEVTYIIEHIAQRAIGLGIVPKARTGDAAWNRIAERHFEDRACGEAWAFDASNSVNFYSAQSLLIRQVAIDGDCFAQKLVTQSDGARFRFIGGESVGSTFDSSDKAFDGLLLDKFGAPISYRVITDHILGKYVDVPAADMMHIRHVRRIGQPRGISWLHSAIIPAQDKSETKSYVKGAFKLGSQIGYTITSNEQIKIGLGSTKATDANGNEISQDNIFGGTLIPRLKPGENIQSFKNEIPGPAFEPLMRDYTSDIARAIGVPPEALMLLVGLAGTETRALLEVAQNFLDRIQQMVIDQFCFPAWKYWVWQEVQSGRLPYPGDDWWRVEWVTPRKITVDNGRDGRLYAQLLDSGYLSWERYCNLHGLDAEAEEDDILSAYIRRKQKCESLGLDIAQVFPSSASSIPAQVTP